MYRLRDYLTLYTSPTVQSGDNCMAMYPGVLLCHGSFLTLCVFRRDIYIREIKFMNALSL